MIYLKSFDFPSVQQEINYTWRGKKTNLTCYSTDFQNTVGARAVPP